MTAVTCWFHGTDSTSGLAFLNGMDLNLSEASRRKIDGPPGFFLSQEKDDAAFFALRRNGTILQVEVSDGAYRQLIAAGMIRQAIPAGFSTSFLGDELLVPPESFDTFNRLRLAAEIHFLPARWP